ncbi:GumC family protein [Wenyingzhuangia sp. IMCC45533]
MYNNNEFNVNNDSSNIRAEIEKYLTNWKWFVLSVFICASIAVVYAKKQLNIFQTQASIQVKEDGKSSSELMAFQDLTSFGLGGGNNVIDEIEILKSRTLSEACVKKIGLNFEIYQKVGLKNIEVFNNRPINYQVISDKESFYELDTMLNLKIIDNVSFEYSIAGSEEEVSKKRFGEKLRLGKHQIIFTPNEKYNSSLDNNYQVYFKNSNVIEALKTSLIVTSAENSSIIKITLNHPVKEKAQLILNTLVNLYNQMSVEDKNLVGKKTSDFIDQRLEVIKTELDEVDKLEEIYKTDKQITDIGAQSSIFVNAKSQNELEIFKKETKLRLTEFMLEDIDSQKTDFNLLPTNIGSEEYPQLNLDVSRYNALLFERNRLLRASSMSNPVVRNLNIELSGLIKNIEESLKNIKRQLEISIISLNSVEKEFQDRISSLPKQAREYRTILRRQTIIAELYSYLLQKKEENEISMAVTLSNSKVIDRAYSLKDPIAPRKALIALFGLIIGFVIPFGIIYIKELLDNKFHNKNDLQDLISLPLVGDIPLDKTEEKVIIKKGSRTSTAEAFRLLRTNLDFILSSVNSTSKTIFVTSTISGEGKSFVSVNVAASLALTGKKVLLAGMDLRAPKITQYLGLPNRNGITNYLIDSEITLEEVIKPLAGFDNLYLLSSGIVPPNPAELLLNPKIGQMFEELKNDFDYIVVDTAPVNLVTDTLMLSKYADMFLYVSRANYLDKRMLEVPERLYQEKRLPNMALLINGVDYSRGYGYGYGGYGYPSGENKKSFFKKLFNK